VVKEQLLGLGLTSNEVEIYLVLLNNGELSVNKIGSKSGLHRQVCYDALDRLVEKGFISYIIKNSKKFFKVLNPQKIIDFLDEKKHEIDLKKKNVSTIIPELTQMFQTLKEETDVELVKGKNVLRTIYNDIFKVLKEKKKPFTLWG
jgi:sugar-specific transcriptional regulator TrmB